MVERKPSKLGVAGSSPVSRSKLFSRPQGMITIDSGEVSPSVGTRSHRIDCCAQVAQSVEHVLGKDEVGGSIPLLGFGPLGRLVGIQFDQNALANIGG